MRTRSILLLTTLALTPRGALAGKADTIMKLVQTNKSEVARDKCAKWEAATITDDPELREACAEAAWPVAEMQDSVVAWNKFAEIWKGTEWAELAHVRESQAALQAVGARSPEGDLLEQAELYRGTPAEDEFRKLAADAAVRDAANSGEAVGVATRYPDHPDLFSLVERFPDGFVKVSVQGRTVDVGFDPPVPLPEGASVTASWVARRADGTVQPWDEAAKTWLTSKGVSAAFLDQLPKADEGPTIPVCYAPGQPPGWGPAVEVRVGQGKLVQPIEWDDGCGEDGWPVFLSMRGNRVTSISLRPGHRLDLYASPPRGERPDVRSFVGKPSGTPMLLDNAIYVQAGPVWIGYPVSGGTPWATGRAPGTAAQMLGGTLQLEPVPSGWTASAKGTEVSVTSAKLAKMPAALRTWTIAPGDTKTLSPLVQNVLGLSQKAASARNAAAPVLGPEAGWVKNPDGSVQRLPPTGAKIAGIYRMEDNDLEVALGVLAGMGIARDDVDPLDGWKSDLDNDRTAEVFLRLVYKGKGVLAIIDPVDGSSAATIADARVFMMENSAVRSDRKPADTPFTFRKGDFVYMAWTGSQVTGATTRRRFIEILRTDGSGYARTGFDL